MKKAIYFLMSAVMLLAAAVPCSAAESAKEAPMLNGMFIAPQLTTGANAWSENDWRNVMREAKSAEIGELAIQFAMRVEPGERIYYYPKTGEDDKGGSQKVLPLMLKTAKENGVKIWVGLHINENEWFSKLSAGLTDTAFLDESAALDKEIFDEVWSLYKDQYADTIAGWYLTFEYNNSSLGDKGADNLVSRFYKPVTEYIKSKTPNKPIMCSPLVYTQLVGEPDPSRLQSWKALSRKVYEESRMDIIAPQDGCGWESTMKENLPPWYKALAEAAAESQPTRSAKGYGKAVVYNNPEAYNMNGVSTMTMKRFTDNMKAVAPYVEGHFSFSIHSFLTFSDGASKNGQYPNGSKYMAAYKYYAKNKRLQSGAVPAPANLKAEIHDLSDVSLTFDRAESGKNNPPVAGYYVFRKAGDGEYIRIRELEQVSADQKTVSVIDYNPGMGGEYTYRVYAFDASGNISSKPAEAAVSISGGGVALNRVFGEQITKDIAISQTGLFNASVKSGNGALLSDGRIGKAGENERFLITVKEKAENPARFTLKIQNPTAQSVGFVYLSLLNQPTQQTYLPERIDVTADGEVLAVLHPLREYYDYPIGDIWLPVDFTQATKAETIELIFTMKYPQCAVSELRVYKASPTASAGDAYREPVNLAAGQPVAIHNYYSYSNFSVDDHIGGIRHSGIDVTAGTLTPGYRLFNESYASLLPTRGLGKAPYIGWHEDSAQRSAWLWLKGLGSSFDLTVELTSQQKIRGIEAGWLQDRASAVFLPDRIEVYGLGVGEEVLLGTMRRPSTALLDFDRPPSALNRHRIETQNFLLMIESDKLFKGVRLRVYPQYPSNDHFMKNLTVY